MPKSSADNREVLIDHPVLFTSPAVFLQILARLDAPPAPNANLKKTMQTPAPWN